MPKFRKKPVVVEAIRYPGLIVGTDALVQIEDWLEPRAKALGTWPLRYQGHALMLPSLGGGEIMVQPGEWILHGQFGELYPVIDQVFREIYEPVEGD